MKRLLNFVLRFSIVFFFVFSIFSKVWAVDMEHTNHLIPVPAEIAWQEGSLAMDGKFTIALSGEEESRIKSAANRLIEHLEKRTGLSLLHTLETAPQDAKLAVEWEKPGLSIQSVKEDESYSLVVTPNQAKLTASNPLGIIRGMETFLQLVDGSGDKYVAPCVTIHDHPRFKWRGLLVDVCRHWQSLEVVKRNLDGLAAAKMNVFHWHLSENQGFRVESKKYPKLQELGSAGNFYTQAQIKEVVAYARERGIRVVPEFDIPGHSTAWLVGYPELASIPGPYEIEKHYGVFDPALDPANEKVYQFLDGFVGEMATLFPDEYFHIGG
ncbi:MAG TPA: family 20 glycosylhydrolase, partial [bacterium]